MKLREILRNEYIAAIAAGFLLSQAAGIFISAVIQPVTAYFQHLQRPGSVFAAQSIFNWPQIILALISMMLHLIVALLLLMWVYAGGKSSGESPDQSQSKDQSNGKSDKATAQA